jgi:hypothetical protein
LSGRREGEGIGVSPHFLHFSPHPAIGTGRPDAGVRNFGGADGSAEAARAVPKGYICFEQKVTKETKVFLFEI